MIALLSCFIGCVPRNPKEETRGTEERIKKFPALQELDAMCSQIPKSEKFEFIKKTNGISQVSISYSYYSKLDFEEVKNFYKNYFTEKGWDVMREDGVLSRNYIRFKKDNYEIEIYYDDIAEKEKINYSFTCENTTARY